MGPEPGRPTFDYLSVCSTATLESFELSRLNRAAHLRAALRDMIRECIEAEVEACMARWLIESRRIDVRDPNWAHGKIASEEQRPPEQLRLALPPAKNTEAQGALLQAVPHNSSFELARRPTTRSRVSQLKSKPLQISPNLKTDAIKDSRNEQSRRGRTMQLYGDSFGARLSNPEHARPMAWNSG